MFDCFEIFIFKIIIIFILKNNTNIKTLLL